VTEKPHASHGDDHGHEHHGSPFIQHHYDDAIHQFESGKLGIWLFLAQEVLFFSALFVAYVLYRHHHPEIYSYAHKYLDVKMGAINTAVLIFSSLTAAWAVRCAQLNQRKGLIACLSLTILCALTFLGVKYVEYSHKVHEHILFGRYFDPCVSSGGQPLLTKNNECPGHKTTVEWDASTKAPKAGCFADVALDQDPHEPGVQAQCSVFEVTGSVAKTKKPDGTEEMKWVEKARHPITARCPELTFGHEEGAASSAEHGAEHGKEQLPCWEVSAQPAVCKPGWVFTWRCAGPNCKKEFGSSGPYASQAACNDDRGAAEAKIKAEGTPTVSECTTSGQVGVIVEYGDHKERGEDTRIEAECKAPPLPADAGDIGADRPQQLELGKALIKPPHHVTTHEEHEREAAGPPPEHTGMFFTIYFAMTGLHGVHVLFGVFVFIWLLIRAIKGHFTEDYFGPVDYAALYWHIVDLIWIFLFPLLYLIH
jgi:heme/copper-type cytochrome/quinol oxidase subunit 3